jgi:hypothetical protein
METRMGITTVVSSPIPVPTQRDSKLNAVFTFGSVARYEASLQQGQSQ